MQTLKFSAFVLAAPLMTVAFGSPSANAQTAVEVAQEKGWHAQEWDAEYCLLAGDFADGPSFEILAGKDGHVARLVRSTWPESYQKPSQYTLTINGQRFAMPVARATTMWAASSNKPISAALLDALAKGNSAQLSAAGMPTLTINLTGSAKAVAAFRDCLSPSKASAKHIYVAAPPAPPMTAVEPPPAPPMRPIAPTMPIGNPPPPPKAAPTPLPPGVKIAAIKKTGAISANDYPELALFAGEEGQVGLKFIVDKDGVAKNCQITQSSDSIVLDKQSCALVEGRYRYYPALGMDGKPVPEYRTQTIKWQFPE